MEIITLPRLDVATMGSATPGAGFDVSAPDGPVLATVTLTWLSLDGRVRRWFGNQAQYPFRLTLADPAGATLMTFAKARENTLGGHLRVTVTLADGRTIGSVRQAFPLSGRLSFSDEDGVEIASAETERFSAGYRVVAEPERGIEWGRCDVTIDAAARRRYRLEFPPQAPVLVRSLMLGHVTVMDAALLPQGGRF